MEKSKINQLIESVMKHGSETGINALNGIDVLNVINGSSTSELCEAANGQYQDCFYSVLAKVWTWKKVFDFYNNYSNMELKEAKEKNAKETDQLKKDLVMAENERIELGNTLTETRTMLLDRIAEMEAEYGKEKAFMESVIYRLKAKLYDMEHANDKSA